MKTYIFCFDLCFIYCRHSFRLICFILFENVSSETCRSTIDDTHHGFVKNSIEIHCQLFQFSSSLLRIRSRKSVDCSSIETRWKTWQHDENNNYSVWYVIVVSMPYIVGYRHSSNVTDMSPTMTTTTRLTCPHLFVCDDLSSQVLSGWFILQTESNWYADDGMHVWWTHYFHRINESCMNTNDCWPS
jgi:hypothetical protein